MLTEAQLPSRHVPEENAPLYSLDEVAKHARRDDGWIVVSNRVYDITNFIMNHPGWTNGGQTSTILAITRNLGTDCTEEFAAVHSQAAKALLPQFFIGFVRRQLLRETATAILDFLHWRDTPNAVCGGFRGGPLPLRVDSNDVLKASGVTFSNKTITKNEKQGLGEVVFKSPLTQLYILEFEILELKSLRLFIGAGPIAFDCAACLHVNGRTRPYGERVAAGSKIAMSLTPTGLIFAVDGRSLGEIPLLKQKLLPFIKLDNAPGDAVRVSQRTSMRPPGPPLSHKLDHRLVVKMLGPQADDFLTFNLDPAKTTIQKLRRLLRIVLRARLGQLPPDCDIDIVIHGNCVTQDHLLLKDLGVAFRGPTQNCDIYANLPHTVS